MLTAAQVRANRTRQAAERTRARGHVPRPMPPQAPPAAAERAYTARLRMIVGGALTRAYAPLLRALPDLVAQARQERGDAADWRSDGTHSGRSASAAVKEAARQAQASLGGSAVRAAAQEAAGDAGAHVQAQLGKQVREVLGIDLAADTRAKARTAAFVHENVKLISGIGPTLAAEVERLVLAGLTGGQLHEMLAAAIRRKLQISTDRAELIAIDQVGKIVGRINAARQQDLGVTHFYWRTSKDERVRGNPSGKYPNAVPSHFDREGKRYAYADPPKGKNGEPELPGTAIRCRCGAEADLSTVLGEEPAAPAPRDPAAPDAPNRAPSVEEAEAEAERLRREVEAMLAGQLARSSTAQPTPVLAAIPQSPRGRLVQVPPPPPPPLSDAPHTRKAALTAAIATVPDSVRTWNEYAAANPDGSGSTEVAPGLSISPRDFTRERLAYVAKLTADEIEAAALYSHKGNGVLNSAIRNDRLSEDPRVEATVKSLDSAIAKHAMEKDTYVLRGLNGDWARRLHQMLQDGDAFVEPGYTSTSAATPFGSSVLVRIRIPAGANAAPIPTRYPDENEYLLPRGARFVVTGKGYYLGQGRLEVDMVP